MFLILDDLFRCKSGSHFITYMYKRKCFAILQYCYTNVFLQPLMWSEQKYTIILSSNTKGASDYVYSEWGIAQKKGHSSRLNSMWLYYVFFKCVCASGLCLSKPNSICIMRWQFVSLGTNVNSDGISHLRIMLVPQKMWSSFILIQKEWSNVEFQCQMCLKCFPGLTMNSKIPRHRL